MHNSYALYVHTTMFELLMQTNRIESKKLIVLLILE